jgi:hypothetical protein
LWYLDDECLDGKVNLLLNNFEIITKSFHKIGLEVNERKCVLITEDDRAVSLFCRILSSIIIVKPQSAYLLGAPIDDIVNADFALKTKLDDLRRLCDTLKTLNAHDTFLC